MVILVLNYTCSIPIINFIFKIPVFIIVSDANFFFTNNIFSYLRDRKTSFFKSPLFTKLFFNDRVNKNRKLKSFKKFKINKKLMSFAKKDCIFLHCLPRGSEVDEKVFSSKQSKVWQQALNRVHVQKSILLYCFGKLR